jgi:hypothetical protein
MRSTEEVDIVGYRLPSRVGGSARAASTKYGDREKAMGRAKEDGVISAAGLRMCGNGALHA